MFRMESSVVLKYFEPIDTFVKLRVFTDEEIARLLQRAQISDKMSYVGLVLNACLLHYNDHILPRLESLQAGADRRAFEDDLYALCVKVNPSLDIRNVTIPAREPEVAGLHLLEGPREERRPRLDRLRTMEEELSRRIIGQPDAIASVSRAIKKSMTGLRDPRRPIATFFFVGRTGVGKTELAKALSVYLFQDPSRMLRVDCSEYALPHEYAKLIGAPPGYVGHDQGGILAEAGRVQGETVVLFDEVEKSDPKIHDLLLQLMDEGFVTDCKGHRIPFTQAVVILTSNVGTEEIERIRNRVGFDFNRGDRLTRETLHEETMRSLQDRFRPEFLNRITEIVLFHDIGLRQCEQIVRLFLDDVKAHAANVPLTVRFGRHVPRFLAEKGYRPEFGARELRRTVEREVESPLSDLVIEGRVKQGDVVEIRVHEDQIRFHRN